MEYIQNLSKTINYIENNLKQKLTIEEISQYCGYSKFHFQRLFHQVVGESVGQYIMNRRLAEAAKALVSDSRRILDIALEFGFDSHEVFTRAFKRRFQLNPYQFRKSGLTTEFVYKKPIDIQYLKNKNLNLIVDMEELSLESLLLKGYQAANGSREAILLSWSKLRNNIQSNENGDFAAYGVIQYPDSFGLDIHFTYLAAAESIHIHNKTDSTLKEVILPESKYIIFSHKGSTEDLPLSYEYIYGVWLPKSKFKLRGSYDFERYCAFWDRKDRDIQICIPVMNP
ncbi:helix-turn-helix domain-containing protein [Chengkuizengella axinellae]|uniref:Helix-turn-helix domain-containing protein n=1 Tax=Chengkuizengella axinellae TaxID=3064388 RepID=A0ABT9J060_9BACL|nr:helix-turn-helix domain-containing protein [Chengkuizengella sp. 2205SS18-9]MDP5275016.1 helix-turn-helix domain-containing protein [Chengkuizengella sp. 2205SS18-9]